MKGMWRKSIGIVVLLLLALLWVTAVAAQEPTADEVNRIAKKLYCPVCPNTPLDVCETKACEDWRALIRDMLAAGKDEEAILEYFVSQYGVQVLAAPPRRGFTALVWILPFAGLLVGGWILAQVFRHRHRQTEPVVTVPQDPPPIPTEYLVRLEEDVRKG